MTDSEQIIRDKIADLRALMRGTLDRSKLALMRERLMVELAKLKASGGGGGET